jgi:hypothetical protein
MNTINAYSSNNTDPWAFSASRYSNDMLTQVSVSQQQNKDITLYTDEGDRVTISAGQQSQAFYSNYAGFSNERITGSHDRYAFNQYKTAAFQDERFRYESGEHLSISVDGNLNEQERKDIGKALKTIDKIMTKVLAGGDITKGLARALRLVNRGSISAIEANYSYAKSMAVEHTQVEALTTYSKDGLVEKSAPETNRNLHSINTLIDEMARMVSDTDIEPSKTIQPIKKLFSRLLEELSDDDDHKKPKRRLAKHMEDDLIETIEKTPKRSKCARHCSSD